jgi:molecular chaperone GrpE
VLDDPRPDTVDQASQVPGDSDERDDTTAALEGQLRRALADLDNLRKRFGREVERERAAGQARVAAAWLPVVDDLERALDHATGATEATASLGAGIRAVHDRALTTLAQLGFPRFEDTGAAFDPLRHEAVGVVDSEAPAGTVVAVARPGYGTAGNILRPASVVVARTPEPAGEADGADGRPT